MLCQSQACQRLSIYPRLVIDEAPALCLHVRGCLSVTCMQACKGSVNPQFMAVVQARWCTQRTVGTAERCCVEQGKR